MIDLGLIVLVPLAIGATIILDVELKRRKRKEARVKARKQDDNRRNSKKN